MDNITQLQDMNADADTNSEQLQEDNSNINNNNNGQGNAHESNPNSDSTFEPSNHQTSTASATATATSPNLDADLTTDTNPTNVEQSSQQTASNNNSNNTANTNQEHLPKRNIVDDLFTAKKWGLSPVRQDTPWDLPPSPTNQQQQQQQTNQKQQNSNSGAAAAIAPNTPASTLPPGISQSGDSFRPAGVANDFHGQSAASMANNFGNVDGSSIGANGLANSLGHMNMSGTGVGIHSANRFDQAWRAPTAKPPHQSSIVSPSPFGNPNNLINPSAGAMSKMMVGGGGSSSGNGAQSYIGIPSQQGGNIVGNEFTRAPGPTSSMIDNTMTNKTFGMTNRSSTWSAFGPSSVPNDSDSEWPKSSGISTGNAPQQSNSFDLVQDSWSGSMLIKGLDDESNVNSNPAGMAAFASTYASSSKSPTGSQYEASGIGTWSPVVKGARPGSKWDGDGPDGGRGDSGRFDDGTALWGAPAQNKVDWVEKTGDPNSSNNDKSRQTMAGSNQAYRPQQSSTSLLMSSNTSPASQHNRNQQTLKQHSSHNQFEQQSNALSSQANQPNRGLGLPSNVPSSTQLKHIVQQIHLAVQAGHLNAQILNQPLAPTTLQLLYQLLQHIKILHQLQNAPQFNKSGNQPAQINVNITKTKQHILNLQNQIAATQAVFLKQNNQAQNISSSSRQPTIPNLATGGLVDGGMAPVLPPGISQSGDSFRPAGVINDFHGHSAAAAAAAMANNYGAVDGSSMSANGLANSIGHMNLGVHSPNRFDQAWRGPTAKPQQQSKMVSQFVNPNNLMPSAMAAKMFGAGGNGNPSSYQLGMQGQHGSNLVGGSDFTRAPGPTSSMMDNNMTANKPFGITNRSSTWSAFGPSASSSAVVHNESDSEWPKSSGASTANSMGCSSNASQQSNAFDMVPEFEPGKPWRGSMLMKSVEDDPTMTPASMARSLAPQRKTIWSDEIL